MRIVSILILASLGFAALFHGVSPSLAATAPPLGSADRFAILGSTTVTNTGNTIVNGDLGVSPGNSITGFPSPGTVNGTIHQNNLAAANAQAAAALAFTALDQSCSATYTGDKNLGGLELSPGVYCSTSSFSLTGTLTLNAGNDPNGVWIFIMPASTLTTASDAIVQVTNGGQSCNVFWRVGSSATLGTRTIFTGTIIADQSISLTGGGASISGRAFALYAAVTLDTNTISVCSLLPSITSLKSVQAYSDPVNGIGAGAKAIPGAMMTYTIAVMNSGAGAVDNNTTVITDPIPANTELYVNDIGITGSGPVSFQNGTTVSGLTYTFSGLGNMTDSLSFFNGKTWNYSPTANGNGCDANVTSIKINPAGIFNGGSSGNNPSFSLMFRVRIK